VTEAGIGRLSPRLQLITLGATALAAPPEEATQRFDAALAAPDGQLFPFELARIQLAYGEHLRRTRHNAAARTQLTQANEIFSRLRAQQSGQLESSGPPARPNPPLREHPIPGKALPPSP
jgi:hypothetical protein